MTQGNPLPLLLFLQRQDLIHTSREYAAKRAAFFFIRNHNICVRDVNFDRKEQAVECCSLFMLKSYEVDCIEKGIERLGAETFIRKSAPRIFSYDICIDFLEVLRKVVREVNVQLTPIECVQYGNADFVAWLTVFGPTNNDLSDCAVSDRKPAALEAKQSLAIKTIMMLMPMYGFVVEDVSYHQLDIEKFGVKAVREKYLNVKERVYNLKETVAHTAVLVDQDQHTPRGKKFVISVPNQPPLPPKKRKRGETSHQFPSTPYVIPYLAIVDDLNEIAN